MVNFIEFYVCKVKLVLVVLFLKKEKGKIVYLIEAMLIASLYLMHIAETIYVFIFLFVALLLNFTKLKDLFSLTIGMWLGTLLLFTLPFTQSTISFYLTLIYTFTLVISIINQN